MPRWSKTNKLFDEHLAPSLRGRLRLLATGYHRAHDGENRFWFELTGRVIVSYSFSGFCAEVTRRVGDLNPDLGDLTHWASSSALEEARDHAWRDLSNALKAEGFGTDVEFCRDLDAFLQLSFPEILESPSPIIRALGMLDKRLGKRRLREFLDGPKDSASLVRRFLAIRCEAEGLLPRASNTTCS